MLVPAIICALEEGQATRVFRENIGEKVSDIGEKVSDTDLVD
ncbi:hypothetical protein CA13_52600 [Planctomycetes bacterium CA13]|uniref:Uncharacterized protein n=1 Tax=Novipirellula herctigrandis TaxID=2527986 RepID=A0A5C5Z8V0_9BACT|nr:hypothetical protein CA13_52600 [Planctomycetes bacterium CA13]